MNLQSAIRDLQFSASQAPAPFCRLGIYQCLYQENLESDHSGRNATMSTPQSPSTVDEEYSQALARMVLSSVAFAGCLTSWLLSDTSAPVTLVAPAAVGMYCVFAV